MSDELVPADVDQGLVPAGGPPERVNTGLEELRRAILSWDDQRQALAADGDYEGLAWGAQGLKALLDDLRQLHEDVRLDIGRIVDDEFAKPRQVRDDGTITGPTKVEVPGLGLIQVNGGWTRKGWESERLIRKLLRDVAERCPERIVTPEGEVISPDLSQLLEDIYQMLTTCCSLTASHPWRVGQRKGEEVTGLLAYGVKDEDWCERVGKPRLASVPGAD